jgi:hypothetical protein
MATGKRRRHATQASMWVATQDLPRTAAHPFYAPLNQTLDRHTSTGTSKGSVSRFMPTRSAVLRGVFLPRLIVAVGAADSES